MQPKRQFVYLKEVKKLAKLRKIKVKNNILVNNKYFLFEDKAIKNLFRSGKNIFYPKNYDQKKNKGFENEVEITDNDKDILVIDVFIKLLKAN